MSETSWKQSRSHKLHAVALKWAWVCSGIVLASVLLYWKQFWPAVAAFGGAGLPVMVDLFILLVDTVCAVPVPDEVYLDDDGFQSIGGEQSEVQTPKVAGAYDISAHNRGGDLEDDGNEYLLGEADDEEGN